MRWSFSSWEFTNGQKYQAAVLLGSLAGNDDNRVAIVNGRLEEGGRHRAAGGAGSRARRWWRWLAAARTGRKACRARGVAVMLLAVNADNSIDAAECKHRPGGAPGVGEQPPGICNGGIK